MRYSCLFDLWGKTLCHLGSNIETFIKMELQNSILSENGWEEDTLTELFNLRYEPLFPGTNTGVLGCRHCLRISYPEEPWWNRTLELTRTRQRVYKFSSISDWTIKDRRQAIQTVPRRHYFNEDCINDENEDPALIEGRCLAWRHHCDWCEKKAREEDGGDEREE